MLMLFSSLSLLLSSKESRYTERLCVVAHKLFLMEKRCKSIEASLVQRSNWKLSGPKTGGHSVLKMIIQILFHNEGQLRLRMGV